jgi:5,10-methylenetetrahydromethanopterin reductase
MTAPSPLPPATAPQTPPALRFCFDRTFPPALVTQFARRLEAAGAQQLWVIEDCFYTAGVSLAASALAVTSQLTAGLGILPAVARNPAITAMEIATLCGLAPGRVLPGIGHGVQEWMGRMGARTPSPVTTLAEVITVVRRLLRGERVSMDGSHVHLDGVQLDRPPMPVPLVLAGVNGPKSLAMAGADRRRTGPSRRNWAHGRTRRPPPGRRRRRVPRRGARQAMRGPRAGHRVPGDGAVPRRATRPCGSTPSRAAFYDDLATRYATRDADALATIPADWWGQIGPIGTLDDARAHLDALASAGASSIALVPEPDAAAALAQLDAVGTLLR